GVDLSSHSRQATASAGASMTLAVQLRLPSISIAGRQQLKRIDYTLRFPQCELDLGHATPPANRTNRGNLDSSPPRPISKKAKAALARVPLATLWHTQLGVPAPCRAMVRPCGGSGSAGGSRSQSYSRCCGRLELGSIP